MDDIRYVEGKDVPQNKLAALYRSVRWLHHLHPRKLKMAIENSDTVVTAWDGDRLVGLGRAITDSVFNVYFPDIAVHPDYRRRGVGSTILNLLRGRYGSFYNCTVVAEDRASEKFFKKAGFTDTRKALRIMAPIR